MCKIAVSGQIVHIVQGDFPEWSSLLWYEWTPIYLWKSCWLSKKPVTLENMWSNVSCDIIGSSEQLDVWDDCWDILAEMNKHTKKLFYFSCPTISKSMSILLLIRRLLENMIFAARNQLSRPLRKQQITLTRSNGHACQLWLVDFNPFCFCFSRFIGCSHDDSQQQKTYFAVNCLLEHKLHAFEKNNECYWLTIWSDTHWSGFPECYWLTIWSDTH